MTTKISFTVQLLCVTNNSIAINTWYHHWKTYNKFIYVSLTIYLTFSVFSRIIIWVVQIKLIKWSDNKKKWNHCHPLMQRKKNCKGDVKCETWGYLDFELDMKPRWTAGVCCSLSLLWAAAKGERSYDAKLGGRKVCMGNKRGMDNATYIMKTECAEFLQPLSSAQICIHCFSSGILYWDVRYFGKKEG